MLIYIKGNFTILGQIHSDSGQKFQLIVPVENKPAVVVEINPDNGSIDSFHEFEVSNEMWVVLQTDLCDGRTLTSDLQAELAKISEEITKATRKVLFLLKYCFNQPDLKDNLFSVKGHSWSTDKSVWKQLPMILSSSLNFNTFIQLNANTVKILQNYIDKNYEPFLALKHLHRAKTEDNPRYKWIDATIAAELAIKEFLIRKNSTLEPLIMEVPSPPLDKLYGPILKFFIQEVSPKVKELTEGARIRNKLIHRTTDISIDIKTVNKYVQDVEIAIYHLLIRLYPDDTINNCFFNPRVRLS
jgi:hypothetical protein